jgi:hypothetical protein
MGLHKPYREESQKPLCHECGELAASSCLRCTRPLCPEHLHPEEERCSFCETEYERRFNRLTRGGGVLVAVLGIGTVLLARAGLLMPALAVALGVLLLIMLVAFPFFVLPAFRKRFLRQRAKR